MSRTLTIDRLAEVLDPGPDSVISLVGGGGKTTALFALGRQLPGRVILSTTTKMGSDRAGGRRPLIAPDRDELAAALHRDRVVLCWREIVDHRAEGFSAATVDGWHGLADHVVVEADGSRRRPFKAPAPHEPVVPGCTTILVACVGAAAFGAPIDMACHRPEFAAGIARCDVSDPLTPARLAAVISSPQGSRKDCPDDARFVVLLNQVTDAHAEFVAALDAALGDATPVFAVEPFAPGQSPEA